MRDFHIESLGLLENYIKIFCIYNFHTICIRILERFEIVHALHPLFQWDG